MLSLDPHTLDEVLDSILAVGARAGVPERAARLVAGLRARLDRTAALVAGRRRPRVAVIEWIDPPFAAGHWIPDLGNRPAAGRPDDRGCRAAGGKALSGPSVRNHRTLRGKTENPFA